jgi:hypothetical protein
MGLLLATGALHALCTHPTHLGDLIRDRSRASARMLCAFCGYCGMDALLLLARPRIPWDMVLHHAVTAVWGVICVHTGLDHGAGIHDLLTECMPFLTMLLARARTRDHRSLTVLLAALRLVVLLFLRLPLYARVVFASLRSTHPNHFNRLVLSAVALCLIFLDLSWLPPMLGGFLDVCRSNVCRPRRA